MKRVLVIAVLMLTIFSAAVAQTTGYVNTETILSKMPEFIQAQQQLERLTSQYELQLQEEISVIEGLFARYQEEKARLNDMQRNARENEIITKERAVKEKQAEIFGQEGVIAERTRQLLDPIREVVQQAIDAVAKENGYTMIFDAATVQGIIYTDTKADITDKVVARLGLTTQ